MHGHVNRLKDNFQNQSYVGVSVKSHICHHPTPVLYVVRYNLVQAIDSSQYHGWRFKISRSMYNMYLINKDNVNTARM